MPSNFLDPCPVWMHLMENVFTPLGKTVFLPLGLNWWNRDAIFQQQKKKKKDGSSKGALRYHGKFMLNIYKMRICFIWKRCLLKQMQMKEKKLYSSFEDNVCDADQVVM